MGTDIHLFIETKIADRWHAITPPAEASYVAYAEQNPPLFAIEQPSEASHLLRWHLRPRYTFFNVLAAVRGAGADPRGWPDDPSAELAAILRFEGGDAHSMSWETAETFISKAAIADVLLRAWWDGPDWGPHLVALARTNPTRCLFYFDN